MTVKDIPFLGCAGIPAAPTFEAETLDWETRTVAFGSGVNSGPKDWVDTFVKAAKLHGYWSKAYRVGVYLSTTLDGLKAPLVNTAGSELFDAIPNFVSGDYNSLGLSGGSGNKSLDTRINPSAGVSSAGTNFSFGCYIRAGDTGGKICMGAQTSGDATSGCYIYRDGTNSVLSLFNNNTQISFADSGSGGFYLGTLGAANALTFYKNGVSRATGSGNHGTPPNLNIAVHDGNLGGLGPQWAPTAQKICFYWIGQLLNGTESAFLYTDVQAMQTSASRQV